MADSADTHLSLVRQIFDLVVAASAQDDDEMGWLLAEHAVFLPWDGFVECGDRLGIEVFVRPMVYRGGGGETFGDRDEQWMTHKFDFSEWLESGDDAEVPERISAIRRLLDMAEENLKAGKSAGWGLSDGIANDPARNRSSVRVAGAADGFDAA